MDFREVVKLFIFLRREVNDFQCSFHFRHFAESHIAVAFLNSPVLVSEWNPTWAEKDESTVPYFAQFLACYTKKIESKVLIALLQMRGLTKKKTLNMSARKIRSAF